MVSLLKYINLRDPNDRLLVYSLLILKNLLLLSLIALIFMFFVSFFTKANNGKIIEGNMDWFKSDAQKRREAQDVMDRIALIYALMEQERQRCLISTNQNWLSCGPKYFFPEAHFKEGANKAMAIAQKKYDETEKTDRSQVAGLNSDLNRY